MDLPPDNAALQAHYSERLASLDREHSLVIARRLRHRIFLLLCLALVLFLGLRTTGQTSWLALVPLAAGLATLPAYLGLQSHLIRIQRLQVFHDINLARADGTRTQSGHTGDEFHSSSHLYDRAIAAQAVLRDLLRNHAIGALSTHDLALTPLASPENHGINVHMASPNPEDPLAFDFLLKPGVNPSSNALAIIRMMDIEA
jgi:hypothetical protein